MNNTPKTNHPNNDAYELAASSYADAAAHLDAGGRPIISPLGIALYASRTLANMTVGALNADSLEAARLFAAASALVTTDEFLATR